MPTERLKRREASAKHKEVSLYATRYIEHIISSGYIIIFLLQGIALKSAEFYTMIGHRIFKIQVGLDRLILK
jgi:hypothetical protein